MTREEVIEELTDWMHSAYDEGHGDAAEVCESAIQIMQADLEDLEELEACLFAADNRLKEMLKNENPTKYTTGGTYEKH